MLSLSKHEDANQKPVILRQAQDKDWALLIIWSTRAWLRVAERLVLILRRLCFEERLKGDLYESENHAAFRWSGRGGDRGRSFETGGWRNESAPQCGVLRKCRFGDPVAGFIGAAITGDRTVVWRCVPPTQYPVFLARMPADSLPQQSRPLREREALHSWRGLSHRSFERSHTTEGDGSFGEAIAGNRR